MRALLLGLVALSLAGCPGRGRGVRGDGDAADRAPRVEPRVVEVPLARDGDADARAQLGADLYIPAGSGSAPFVILVPGAGRASRAGTRTGNGSRDYDAPVDVTTRFAEALARAGMYALAYDKRTCAPRDDPACTKNPVDDVDAEGPIALARDVDAACALVRAEPGFDGRLVLWSHSQGTQVVLASSCAKDASALVLIAPIPDRVDEVLVRGLSRRAELLRKWGEEKVRSPDPAVRAEGETQIEESLKLQNRAANFRDVFRTLEAGGFPEDARVLGATQGFWSAWIALTGRTAALAEEGATPRLVVLGQHDSQYAPVDKNRVAALAAEAPHRFVVVEEGDHYLLIDKVLEERTVQSVVDALTALLAAPPPAPAG